MYGLGNVYLSYYNDNKKKYNHVKQLLEVVNETDYEFLYFNKGIESANPQLVKLQIENKILQSEAMIILIGKDTHAYKYINYELDFAAKYDKRIIGIYLDEESKAELPSSFKELKLRGYKKISLVKWNDNYIVEAFNSKLHWME